MPRRVFIATLALMLCGAQAAWAGPEGEIRALFERFVAGQNAHDLGSGHDALGDSTRSLWISRGVPVWGREAALKRFDTGFQDTWRVEASVAGLEVTMHGRDAAQLYVPILLTSASAGQIAQSTRILVWTAAGWRVAAIVPVPVTQAAGRPSPAVAIVS
jgi:hypothetical protein